MLSFQEKLDVCSSFPELQRKDVSLGRVNFHYEESAHEKKTVVYHLHPNGNGYVFAGLITGAATDEKGFVNIRDYPAAELRDLIEQSIRSLSVSGEGAERGSASQGGGSAVKKQVWTGPGGQTLALSFEDDLWYVYAGVNLDGAFETLEEAEEYLREEGFSPSGKGSPG